MKSKLVIQQVKSSVLKALTCLYITIGSVIAGTYSIALAQEVLPVLEFPQVGLDDTATYRGYTTRFFRDSEGNTFQISINQNSGRVVNIWADAANESMSFTVRDNAGQPGILTWDSEGAQVSSAGRVRFVQYTLSSKSAAMDIGLFLLGSMRKERDFQFHQRHKLPFESEPYIEEELIELVRNIERLPADVRQRHLALLNGNNIEELRLRLVPKVTFSTSQSRASVLVEQPTFDGKNRLYLELSVDSNQAKIDVMKEKISIRSLQGQPFQLIVKVGTDSPSLIPLRREDIFNRRFFTFYEHAKVEYDSLLLRSSLLEPGDIEKERLLRFKWLDRQVKSVELLSYQEKLMAGLPNFATYFGRDMIMSALMLEPVWTPAMLEHVIASVLRKVSPSGEVSHEEGLGCQAIRENAAHYNQLIAEYFQCKRNEDDTGAESALARAEKLLADLQAVTENYRMLDDDFQLPVLAARYLTRADIPTERKREFLKAASGKGNGTSRLNLLMRNLLYVTNRLHFYVENPVPENLVGFPKVDGDRWFSGSWRDSRAGYANGRFAMDINAIWASKALESVEKIFATSRQMGISIDELQAHVPDMSGSQLIELARNREALRQAVTTWRSAMRHFEVNLSPQEVQQRVRAKLEWLPAEERGYWEKVIASSVAHEQGISFLALSLDGEGRPIPVANTDPATWLFLNDFVKEILNRQIKSKQVLKWFEIFAVPYPIGLFLEGVGAVAANDAYAFPEVWENFERDPYHSPRTVWGREINLFLLGSAKQILNCYDSDGKIKDPILEPFVQEVRRILDQILAAVESSGLKHNELWSYEVVRGKLLPARYPTSSDIQLWNLTDLAVRFLLNRLSNL
ncbi:MAG: hypothetical protein ACE5NG_09195 [bacterium]